MKKLSGVVLIGLAVIGAVYAGTRLEEMTNESKNKQFVKETDSQLIALRKPGNWAELVRPDEKEVLQGLEGVTREQKNKLLVKVAIGAMNTGDWETLAEVYSPKFIHNGPYLKEPVTWTNHEQGCRLFRRRLSGYMYEIEEIIAEGNKVVVRLKTVLKFRSKSKHGIWKYETFVLTEIDIFKIEAGRIVEEWCEYDLIDRD